MVRLVLIVEVHGGGRIVEHRQQILLHVPHRGGVLCQRIQHKSNLRNVYGTFAIEGMTISKDTRSNLDRIGSGQASYQQVVNELRAKYAKEMAAASVN